MNALRTLPTTLRSGTKHHIPTVLAPLGVCISNTTTYPLYVRVLHVSVCSLLVPFTALSVGVKTLYNIFYYS